MKNKLHTLKWFISRINKEVNGRQYGKTWKITIRDLTHAKYLHMVSRDLDIHYW